MQHTEKRAEDVKPGDILVWDTREDQRVRRVHLGRVTDRVLIVTDEGMSMYRKSDILGVDTAV